MDTIISDVTTTVRIESEHSGYTFKGSAEIYNGTKTIKSINCQVTKKEAKETVAGSANPAGIMQYNVTRSVHNGMGMSDNIVSGEKEAIVAAGIEFERILQGKIETEILK